MWAEAESACGSAESKNTEYQFTIIKNFRSQQWKFGYWQATTSDIKPGEQYKFVLDGKDDIPIRLLCAQPEVCMGLHRQST